MTTGSTTEPYQFDPEFERIVVYFTSTRPSFYQRIGYLLDDQALGSPHAKLIIESLHIAANTSLKNKKLATIGILERSKASTPASRPALLQILRNRVTEEGKIKLDAVISASQWLGAEPTEAEDEVVQRLLPTLKRRAQQAGMEASADEYANRKDPDMSVRWFDVVKTLGQRKTLTKTLVLGPEILDALDELKQRTRQKLGIPEIDQYLEGGMPQGQLCMGIGGPGDGKSMMLMQHAAEMLLDGRNVAIASLELPSAILATRLLANLTGFQISDIVQRGLGAESIRICSEAPGLGTCLFQDFTPQGTYVDEVLEWVVQEEKERNLPIHGLVVDYADKLVSKKSDRIYDAMKFVYEDLRLFAEHSTPMRWVWTASQATRKELIKTKKDGSERKLERTKIFHVADSQEKVRVADIVLGLTREGDMYVISIEKNRTGESGRVFEDMPVDFSRGRVVVLPRPGLGASSPMATPQWTRVNRPKPIGGPATAPRAQAAGAPPLSVPLPAQAKQQEEDDFQW